MSLVLLSNQMHVWDKNYQGYVDFHETVVSYIFLKEIYIIYK